MLISKHISTMCRATDRHKYAGSFAWHWVLDEGQMIRHRTEKERMLHTSARPHAELTIRDECRPFVVLQLKNNNHGLSNIKGNFVISEITCLPKLSPKTILKYEKSGKQYELSWDSSLYLPSDWVAIAI